VTGWSDALDACLLSCTSWPRPPVSVRPCGPGEGALGAAPATVNASARRRLRPGYRRLFWRIFLANAVVLAAACAMAVVILSPGIVSSPVASRELGIFAAALFVMVIANLLVTQRLVAPLEELVRVMRRVDLTMPGERVSVGGGPSEATELAAAFNDMLERLEAEREESIRRVIGAQEAERLRVAQELHDEVGQNLTAALLQLARVRRRAGPELEAEVSAATETVRANLDDLRRIAQRLRPQALDELGLTSALSQFSARLSAQAGLRIDARLDSHLPPLTREEELVIYRVAQEALTNVVRHAGATRSELELARGPDGLTLRVSDDGSGIEASDVPSGGIRGMHERATLIHADLRVGRPEGGGTEVVLHLPLDGDGT
jgi:two-component system, NarL family, sensor histidine kinase UhpB